LLIVNVLSRLQETYNIFSIVWFGRLVRKRGATFARRLREKQQHASKPVFMHVSSMPMECAIAGKQSRRLKRGCAPDNKKIDRNGFAISFRTACRPAWALPNTCPNVRLHSGLEHRNGNNARRRLLRPRSFAANGNADSRASGDRQPRLSSSKPSWQTHPCNRHRPLFATALWKRSALWITTLNVAAPKHAWFSRRTDNPQAFPRSPGNTKEICCGWVRRLACRRALCFRA
jgi:hypothetical protein